MPVPAVRTAFSSSMPQRQNNSLFHNAKVGFNPYIENSFFNFREDLTALFVKKNIKFIEHLAVSHWNVCDFSQNDTLTCFYFICFSFYFILNGDMCHASAGDNNFFGFFETFTFNYFPTGRHSTSNGRVARCWRSSFGDKLNFHVFTFYNLIVFSALYKSFLLTFLCWLCRLFLPDFNCFELRTMQLFPLLNPDWSIQISGAPDIC